MNVSSRVVVFTLALLAGFIAPPASGRPIVALTGTNQLVHFDSAAPATITSTVPITGLANDERIRAIDFRPANGRLYGLAIRNEDPDVTRICVIDPVSGKASPMAPLTFNDELTSAESYGFDFNPVADRIRIVNGLDKNLRANPNNGVLVQFDADLDNPSTNEGVVAVAYDRNDRNPGTAQTTLFGIDFAKDTLVRIGDVNGSPSSPNDGVLTTIGSLGLTSLVDIGFDIDDAGVAYASIGTNSANPIYRLYTINLNTGAATPVPAGTIGSGTTVIRDIAVIPKPVTNANTFEVFDTIQAAIDDPNTGTGHAIDVNPGTYGEMVTVHKGVTLRGAHFGVDPRGPERFGQESVVHGAPAGASRTTSFHVTANNVRIDGFSIQDTDNSAQILGAAIFVGSATSGTEIRNNVIKNNLTGVAVANNPAQGAVLNPTIIEANVFTANGLGVFSDENVSGGALENVIISDNRFSNHELAVFLGPSAGTQTRVVISNNLVVDSQGAFAMSRLTQSIITRNFITSSSERQIAIGSGVDGLTISENVIQNGTAQGLVINTFGGAAPATNVFLNCNFIVLNEVGLEILAGAYTGTLDATGNWWGSASGPTTPANPGGDGQQIIDPAGQVDSSNFQTRANDQQQFATGYECAAAATLYGVDVDNKLIRFSSLNPENLLSSKPITGLQAGEKILGIDFRPTTGELFAIGDANRLYVINPATAAATLRAVLTAAPDDDNPFTSLVATGVGVSFNPVTDLAGGPSLRVVNDVDGNFRINVDNGQVLTDNNINPPELALDAAAYINVDLDPATVTALFAYDFTADQLAQATNANGGTYNAISRSGLRGFNEINLDVQTADGPRNVMFASVQPTLTVASLYVVDLRHGLFIPLGQIGTGVNLTGGLAVAPEGTLQFSAESYSVSESNGTAAITINRVAGSDGPVAVTVRSVDGTATAGIDYVAVDQLVFFSAGEVSKTINITINNDSGDELSETITLSLRDPENGAMLGQVRTAVLTIVDDDLATPTLGTSAPATPVGRPLVATATIANGGNPTGTITFSFYAPEDSGCGAPIFSSTAPVNGNGTYSSAPFTPARTGTYRVIASYSGDGNNFAASGSCNDPSALVSVTEATALANIATRLLVQPGDNVLIGGITITGSLPKRMIVRAIGPSADVPGALPDPQLQLFAGDELVTANDNWRDAPNQQEIIDTTLAPPDDRESAILITLNPGQYTAVVSGVNGESGVGLVDAYDLDRTVDSKFANIATRGLVQTGDDVMIGGLTVVGDTQQTVLVRAIGPSLPIEGKLADPTLQLVDANGDAMATNDNWRDDQQAQIEATSIPPPDDLESAILATLAPGQYTAVVRGAGETTGVALAEVYALE